MRTRILFYSLSLFGSLLPAVATARVQPAPIFASNMVLQRDVPVPVWGTADAGEKVTVRFAGQEKTGVADAQGKWRVTLDPLAVSDQPRELEILGPGGGRPLSNVLVGDVWLCVGQSNMAFNLGKARDAETEIAGADFPSVRSFGVHFNSSLAPRDTLSGGWMRWTPESARRMSAVSFFYGRELHRLIQVPVGIIGVSLSGSYAEVWFSREAQLANPATRGYIEAWDWLSAQVRVVTPAVPGGAKAVYADGQGNPLDTAAYRERFKAWRIACAAARDRNQPLPEDFPAAFALLGSAPLPDNTVIRPAGGFNGSIAPLLPFPIKGAVWYQGESHFVPEDYGQVLGGLISDWRRRFGVGDFPFLVVGLPNWGKSPAAVPVESKSQGSWALVREQQLQLAKKLPGVFVTVNTDTAVFDKGDLHPTNKQPVGRRLALLAADRVYGQTVRGESPLAARWSVEGRGMRVTFDHADGGLDAPASEIVNLPKDLPASPVLGFAIAGADRQWKWAEARIEGDAVVVSAPGVEKPVAVRYNWANYPVGNLFGKTGLPAAPFRTDDWSE